VEGGSQSMRYPLYSYAAKLTPSEILKLFRKMTMGIEQSSIILQIPTFAVLYIDHARNFDQNVDKALLKS
jgi:hypothetical protein